MTGKYFDNGQDHDVYDVCALGAGLELLSDRKQQFTHKRAEEILSTEEFMADRPLRENHVARLIDAMKRETFHPEWVQLITCECEELGNKTFRMNGQHTSWARLHMPANYPCQVRVMHYRAKTASDMRRLYASIDRNAPRTKENVINSYLGGTNEYGHYKKDVRRVLSTGIVKWLWPSSQESKKYDGDDIAYLLMTEYFNLAQKVGMFLNHQSYRDQRHLFRSGVVAAMFATFSKAPQIAEQFWSSVAEGTGIENKEDPRLKLRNELMQVSTTINTLNSAKKRVSAEYMYRACIHAWNTFRRGDRLKRIRPNMSSNRPRPQ